MKTPILSAAIVSSFCILHSAFGQGALTPPAAPAPTMKSLDQIEARTPISAAPFTITTSGSYYLTTNLTVSSGSAIILSANNITLDLNGFTLSSTRPVATVDIAILINGVRTNISIFNGHISGGVTNTDVGMFGGSGFAGGIAFSTTAPSNVRVKDVSVGGMLTYGIYLGVIHNSVVESCTVLGAGNYGIYADNISDSVAINCGNYGINGVIVRNCAGGTIGGGTALFAGLADNCSGTTTGTGRGLNAVTANNCYASSSGNGDGLTVNVANNCYGSSGGNRWGIYAEQVATGCYGKSSSGVGLYAFIANVCHGESLTGTPLSTSHNVNSF